MQIDEGLECANLNFIIPFTDNIYLFFLLKEIFQMIGCLW